MFPTVNKLHTIIFLSLWSQLKNAADPNNTPSVPPSTYHPTAHPHHDRTADATTHHQLPIFNPRMHFANFPCHDSLPNPSSSLLFLLSPLAFNGQSLFSLSTDTLSCLPARLCVCVCVCKRKGETHRWSVRIQWDRTDCD